MLPSWPPGSLAGGYEGQGPGGTSPLPTSAWGHQVREEEEEEEVEVEVVLILVSRPGRPEGAGREPGPASPRPGLHGRQLHPE